MPQFLIAHRPRVAVIGYGFAGRSFHSYLVSLAPGLELAGVASRDEETRRKIVAERRCRAYESFEEVLDDPAIDLVVLATPHNTHAPMAVRALTAGKHVVTDKVMALNLAECDAMIDAARRADRFLTVFHNRRFDGDFLTVRRAIAEGTLGDVRWVEAAWQKYGAWRKWRGSRAAGGGRLLDLGAHLVDQVLLLNPAPVTGVFCRMHADFPEVEVESHAMVTLSFADGRTAIVDVGCMSRRPKPRFLVVGSGATLEKFGIDSQEAAMIAGDIDAAKEDPAQFARVYGEAPDPTVVPTVPGRWRNFYENVADVLTHGADPLVKLPEMRRLMSVLDACFESARGGQVVRPVVG